MKILLVLPLMLFILIPMNSISAYQHPLPLPGYQIIESQYFDYDQGRLITENYIFLGTSQMVQGDFTASGDYVPRYELVGERWTVKPWLLEVHSWWNADLISHDDYNNCLGFMVENNLVRPLPPLQ